MAQNNSLNWKPIQYNLLVGDANNNISNIPPGIANNIFTSNGISSNASFQSIPSGIFVKLQTQNPSNVSNVIFTSTYITSTYSTYFLIFNDVIAVSGSAST